ncbi:MAG TPA: peptidylprolyl isomerase, partial [Kofleriaceae bacterium]
VGSLNVSPGSYRQEQKRSMQAALMAELIRNGVRVSRDEALADYLYTNDTVTYDVVAFDPNNYRAVMHLGDADIKRYLDGHAAEIEARYKADTALYKGVKPQLAIREIFIPKAFPLAPAKPDDKKDDKADKDKKDDKAADGKKPASNTAENPRGLPLDVAKTKLEAVRAQIAAGKLKLADAEKQLAADSSDDSPQDNGDRGWMPADTIALGDKEVNDATKALKPGELTKVISTDRGTYLVTVVDKREGDLGFDQVKTEIAASLAKDAWAKEAAKRDALKALADASSGGKTLDQMFERASAPPMNLEDLLNNPNMTPQQREQIQKLLQQKQQIHSGGKHGALETHEVDVPVGWFADADGSSGGAPAAAPAAPAATPAPAPAHAAGSAAPTAGSAAPAAGSAAGSAAAPAAPPPPPPVSLTPSNDVLPPMPNVAKPHVERIGPAPRQPKMSGLGNAKDAANALFDELAPGQVGKSIYVGDNDSFVVVQLVNRAQPKVEEFDKTADHELAQLQEARGKAALGQWLKDRCDTLTKAGKIKPASDRIRETDDKGNPAPTIYHPCMYFDAFNH